MRIDFKKKKILEGFVKKFEENDINRHYNLHPKFVFAIPIQTMDYWMKCLDEKDDDCTRIRKIEHIDMDNIKKETYGESNIYMGWSIDEDAIDQKIKRIKNESLVLDKLRCFPSFSDFEGQLKEALGL